MEIHRTSHNLRASGYLFILHFLVGSAVVISSCRMACHAFIKHSTHVPSHQMFYPLSLPVSLADLYASMTRGLTSAFFSSIDLAVDGLIGR